MSNDRLSLGLMPLTDSAPLVVAARAGFFEAAGLAVELVCERAWSSVRDRLMVGALDCAQLLAPMPISMTLGLDQAPVPTLLVRTLSRNGNAITVSTNLAAAMRQQGWQGRGRGGAARSARALRAVIDAQPGRRPLRFGVVFHVSTHFYQLRNWLIAGGIDPDRDVEIITVPPSRTAEALGGGQIDGYCVGEPWNHLAVSAELGEVVATSDQLSPGRSEKVLAVCADGLGQKPEVLSRLDRALAQAQTWLSQPVNRLKAATWLIDEGVIDAPFEIVAASMLGIRGDDAGLRAADYDGIHVFPVTEDVAKRLADLRFWSVAMRDAGQIDFTLDDSALERIVWADPKSTAVHNR